MPSKLQSIRSWSRQIAISPLVVALSVGALVVQLLPGAAELLECSRTALAAGEFWKLFTSHFTHCNWSHFIWDAIAFVLLAGWVTRHRGDRYLVTQLVAQAAVIPVLVFLLHAGVQSYRGLSGLCSGLFIAAVVDMLYFPPGNAVSPTIRLPPWLVSLIRTPYNSLKFVRFNWLPLILISAFCGKITWETFSGGTVFVHSLGAESVAVPAAHAAGGIVAACVHMVWCWRERVSTVNRTARTSCSMSG